MPRCVPADDRLPGDLTSSDVLRRQRANAGGPQPPLAVEGTPGSEFIDGLKPAAGDIVLPAYRPDAFFGTPLDPILKWHGIKTVVFLGIHAWPWGTTALGWTQHHVRVQQVEAVRRAA